MGEDGMDIELGKDLASKQLAMEKKAPVPRREKPPKEPAEPKPPKEKKVKPPADSVARQEEKERKRLEKERKRQEGEEALSSLDDSGDEAKPKAQAKKAPKALDE